MVLVGHRRDARRGIKKKWALFTYAAVHSMGSGASLFTDSLAAIMDGDICGNAVLTFLL